MPTLYHCMRIDLVQRASAQFDILICHVRPQALLAGLLNRPYLHSVKHRVEME